MSGLSRAGANPAGGAFSVRVDTREIRALALRLDKLSVQFGTVLDTDMEEETEKAVKRIQKKWPVDTGRSRGLGVWTRSGWQYLHIKRFAFSIFNPTDYTSYVHRSGQKTPLVNFMVPREVKKARVAIIKEARRLIAKAMKPKRKRSLAAQGRFRV